MYFNENTRHNLPHIHAEYAKFDSIFDLKGNQLEGKMPNKQKKMIEVWISIHEEELMALWKSMQHYQEFFKINPLK